MGAESLSTELPASHVTEEPEEPPEEAPEEAMEEALEEETHNESAEPEELAEEHEVIEEPEPAIPAMPIPEMPVEMPAAVSEEVVESQPAQEVAVENTLSMQHAAPAEASVRPAAAMDVFRPANLDQFSRDRFYVQPLIGADRFLLIDPHLLEIIISDRMVVRKGTISSFTGRISFMPYANEDVPLIEVAGSGILFLADRRKDIFVISLNNESIYVESNHLLVAQSVLKVEPYSLQHGDDVFSTVKVSGRGTIAITCQTKPLTLNVYESMPANIPAEALIAWSGNLTTEVVSDAALYSVMMQPDDSGALLRFSGAGDVVVEQGSLWGDRRMRK
jgi:uncharacterized protein (AIM24 family)